MIRNSIAKWEFVSQQPGRRASARVGRAAAVQLITRPAALERGQRVGPYEIVAFLVSGGMGRCTGEAGEDRRCFGSDSYPAVTRPREHTVLFGTFVIVDWFGTEESEAWRAAAFGEGGFKSSRPDHKSQK
jgi:hypothetical protein